MCLQMHTPTADHTSESVTLSICYNCVFGCWYCIAIGWHAGVSEKVMVLILTNKWPAIYLAAVQGIYEHVLIYVRAVCVGSHYKLMNILCGRSVCGIV
jgi:DNA repair photolyase